MFMARTLKAGFSGFFSQVGFGELPFDSTDNFNSCSDVCFRVADYNFLCHKVCACAMFRSPVLCPECSCLPHSSSVGYT